MTNSKTKQVNFRTPEELYERIKIRAEVRGETISSYMNTLALIDIEYAGVNALANEREILLEILKSVKKLEKRLDEIETRI